MEEIQNKQIMDIKEVSEYLGIGKSKIYSLIKMKKIPAYKIGRQYRFSKEIVDGWLKDKIITKKDNTAAQNTVSVKLGQEK
ncbi:MAG: helix-turn-helix domain-containing protein [Endomicrobium sp.]|jgi:excisionase family DNA binding protein|uniref:helix-turn-helix domain-containing protein n=1 Tax=Candidatus Endomicrobiellum cubanum TaxID=3242325 RepID=UPI002828A858|nr:helix-turn-helix domain-containing protein [Endomicrobium sp.]MDR2395086.1 helix-turn-helix domain-containing protein [Endomicrobium sp.]